MEGGVSKSHDMPDLRHGSSLPQKLLYLFCLRIREHFPGDQQLLDFARRKGELQGSGFDLSLFPVNLRRRIDQLPHHGLRIIVFFRRAAAPWRSGAVIVRLLYDICLYLFHVYLSFLAFSMLIYSV